MQIEARFETLKIWPELKSIQAYETFWYLLDLIIANSILFKNYSMITILFISILKTTRSFKITIFKALKANINQVINNDNNKLVWSKNLKFIR